MKVLVAEDDRRLRDALATILRKEGYTVVVAADGDEALELFERERPEFICLDIMMPQTDGFQVCRVMRQRNATTPIIFISAKSEERDKVAGLEMGADDFITKPFGMQEVIARIRAVTRRCLAQRTSGAPPDLPFTLAGDLEVRPEELRAYREGQTIELSLRDVKLLRLLYQRRGRAVRRDDILDEIWGVDFVPESRVLDQHVAQLRKRIERTPRQPRIIRTVHGVGYRYDG